MRLFIGVPLPPNARLETTRLLGELRAQEWPVRWVRDEGLHVSLKFFGELTSDRVDAIGEMLSFAAQGMKPIGMSMQGIGVFPAWERPRVIHLELVAGSDLELLQDRIERGGERLGFSPEGRPFRPHITLGRVREGQRLPSGWNSVLEQIRLDDDFIADRVVLYESQLSASGPAYTARTEVVLA
jgi:RNA 2',3'-cyclic 3'-phosphodiesterase